MSSDPAIVVSHVSKTYDLGLTGRSRSLGSIVKGRIRHPLRGSGAQRERFLALDDVSFEVEQGDVVGVVGKNGAGKSTLLKILSRITQPSAGYVEMMGTVGCLLEVGTGFHPELTGIENVYLNGTILGMSKREIDSRLDEILEFAAVDNFLDTPVKRYSSGMRVRLAFAVAAHLDPDVLIIDEVLSVGDAGFQAKCIDKMRQIASQEGRTVLYVSHNLVTVENLCNRALLMVNGKIDYEGEPSDTISRYLALFPRADRGDLSGVFDLGAAERGSEYHSVFKRLEFRPGGGLPSDTIRTGDSLRIEITVDDLAEHPDAIVMVGFGSPSTPCLFRLTSRMIPLQAASTRQRSETIVMDFPSLPLAPGDYQVEIQLKENGKNIDLVRPAAEFHVVPGDVFQNGYRCTTTDGYFVLPWEWELHPAAVDSPTR